MSRCEDGMGLAIDLTGKTADTTFPSLLSSTRHKSIQIFHITYLLNVGRADFKNQAVCAAGLHCQHILASIVSTFWRPLLAYLGVHCQHILAFLSQPLTLRRFNSCSNFVFFPNNGMHFCRMGNGLDFVIAFNWSMSILLVSVCEQPKE